MRINHNISALKANNKLLQTGNLLSSSLERLSSGYRINRASDDAAGLAISRKMKTQIEGLEQASRNGADGISVIQSAEGALSEVESMLQRMRELSVQAANDVNTTEDRMSIQKEINQLNAEIQRISDDTEFNTKPVINGSIDNNYYSSNNQVSLIYISDSVQTIPYTMYVTRDPRQAVVVGEVPTIDEIAEEEAGMITINGHPIAVSEGESLEKVFAKIRGACDSMNIKAFFGDGPQDGYKETAGYEEVELGGGNLIFMSTAYGSDQTIEIQCNNEDLSLALGLSTTAVKAYGVDAQAVLSDGFSTTATVTGKGDVLYVTDSSSFEMRFQTVPGASETSYTDATGDGETIPEIVDGIEAEAVITVLDAGPMDIQIGANEGQSMTIRIPCMNPTTLGIAGVNVCTHDGAQKAITAFDKAVNEVSAVRAKLGAYQNRLDHAIANVDVTNQNMTEAMSRIEDVNMATEMTNYTSKNVLEQAGTAMLAQANQRPENMLALLNA